MSKYFVREMTGWELFYPHMKDELKNESDMIIAIVHYYLEKNKFLCSGIGDEVIAFLFVTQY